MTRVGLTGGIASGKSTVGSLLAEHGALVIDSDQLAREVVAPGTSGLRAVVDRFGGSVLMADGQLDRAALAQLVFDHSQARSDLEAIIHPLVRARAREIEATATSGPAHVVVHDIPLLVETGQAGDFDVVVVVDAPEAVQLERLTRLRAMTPGQAQARIDAQASRPQRLAAADEVIVNDGRLRDLRVAVDDLWQRLTGMR